MSETKRVRMTGQERREQLIEVARGIFASKGYEATAVEEIAERAGVTKPLIYQHFGGKEGLYAVVLDREVTSLTERITSAMDAIHPRAAAEQAANAFLTYIEECEDGFRILLRDAPSGTSSGTLASVIGDIAAQTEALLATEFKARGFDKKTAPMYARMLVGAVALTGEWWLEARKPSREVVAAHLVNLMWNGLHGLEKDPTRKR